MSTAKFFADEILANHAATIARLDALLQAALVAAEAEIEEVADVDSQASAT